VPLRDRAAARGILFGAATGRRQLAEDLAFGSLVTRECALIVPENEMKWHQLCDGSWRYDFADADWLADFARGGDQGLRGQTLLWHGGLPPWTEALAPKVFAEEVGRHIRIVVGRYRGLVHTWDVVNEPVRPADGRADGLRREPFLSRLGPEYLADALHAAREADGSVRLCINEFDLEYEGPYFEERRTAMLRLVERLKAEGAPLDAVGVQSHLSAGAFSFSERRFRLFLTELASLNVRIELTELDVADAKLPADATERDRLVADEYERYLTVALDEPATDVVVTWGLSDRYTWLNTDSPPTEKRRNDGSPSRPLLFDGNLRAKVAWRAVARAFDGAPSR
jgi:endo-1,4-beta-xylanase